MQRTELLLSHIALGELMKVRLALRVVAFLFALNVQISASAQTTVTTSDGTTNTVPVFTGNATLGNSPVSASCNGVGVAKEFLRAVCDFFLLKSVDDEQRGILCA
jgi:hypothetical protein